MVYEASQGFVVTLYGEEPRVGSLDGGEPSVGSLHDEEQSRLVRW